MPFFFFVTYIHGIFFCRTSTDIVLLGFIFISSLFLYAVLLLVASVWVAVQECCALCLKVCVCVCLCACLCISVGGQKNASQENFWALRLSAVKARNAPFPFLLCFQVESASTHHTPSSASRRSKRTWNCLKNTAVQTFCTPKQCIQNRGSAGEDLWSRQCGNPGYQAKKKHIEMTSKWRASFTFPRSLDCSCRLLCWATALLPPQLQTRSTLLPFEATSATPAAAYFFSFAFSDLVHSLILFSACL